jgi:hypothetical protein
MLQVILRSGGQTGVDRAALDFAIQHKLPYAGWCPRNGWAEDYLEAPGLLAKYPNLTETPTGVLEQRSSWNVRDSDATIILTRGEADLSSQGVSFSWISANVIFEKPFHVVDMTQPHAAQPAREWLQQLITQIPDRPMSLNVAGPRESIAPGIYDQATQFLSALLA